MGREIDLSALIVGLSELRRRKSGVSDAVEVTKAILCLRRTGLPDAYVDGIQDELLQMLCEDRPPVPCDYVYLAFHGNGGCASHMKVGIARNVKKRMAALYTGNPLPRLWVYAAPFKGRHIAYRIERALLAHMGSDRTTGEWICLGGLSEAAAASVSESLAEVASLKTTQPVQFSLMDI